MAYVAKVTAGGQTGMLVGSTLYGACSTAAATVAKEVTISGFDTLITGVTIHVKFTYGNTAASPTLKVGSTGAKAIKMYGTTAVGNTKYTSWYDGAVVSFTYDGTNWVMNDFGHYQLDASRLVTGTVPAARLPSGNCYILNGNYTLTNTDTAAVRPINTAPYNIKRYFAIAMVAGYQDNKYIGTFGRSYTYSISDTTNTIAAFYTIYYESEWGGGTNIVVSRESSPFTDANNGGDLLDSGGIVGISINKAAISGKNIYLHGRVSTAAYIMGDGDYHANKLKIYYTIFYSL